MSITIEEYERIVPIATIDWEGGSIQYSVPSTRTLWRVETLPTKEPDTIDWIGRFEPDDVFVDVGANIGIYSVFAAVTRQASVFAFEPESLNYAELNKNIYLNGISGRVHAYCVALSDTSGFGDLHLSNFEIGSSCHAFGEKLDYKLEPFESPMAQGCLSMTLDELVAAGSVPVPKHIKIDVDGIEHKVIAGATNVLRDTNTKSVLVELNTNLDSHRALVDQIEGFGFVLDRESRDRAVRQEGDFKGVGNHIFWRHGA